MKWIIGAIIIVILALGAARFLPWNPLGKNMGTLKLTSPAFENGGFIGSKYTCDEQGITPPLKISGVPSNAKSLAIVMNDPDVPKQLRADGNFDHWVVYNIPAKDAFYDEGQIEGAFGVNGAGKAEYAGPCPPKEYSPTTHRYYFRLYALDIPTLNFIKAPTREEILTAIESHIIDQTELMGQYDRTKTQREND